MPSVQFDLKNIKGLNSEEVSYRLKTDGYNELPSSKPKNFFSIALGVLKEPMFLLLIAAALIYLVLGDIEQSIVLVFSVFVVLFITFYQEQKSERAIQALKDLSSPRAQVIRNGEEIRIAGREVVRDDIILLTEGDRVPADSAIIWSSNLLVDESLLTGESTAVRKSVWDQALEIVRPGGEDLPFVYSGTLVVGGQAAAKVLSTGIRTEIGKIGKSLENVSLERTKLQKETGHLAKIFASIGLFLCILVAILYGLSKGDWVSGTLVGITTAMSLLPEEIPMVLTIFLALGAWKISKKNVLTRRIPIIETLGSTTVLCTDKTGTLTQNQMAVKKIVAGESIYDTSLSPKPLPKIYHKIIEFGILASETDPFDPMEKALEKLDNHDLDLKFPKERMQIIQQYPLTKELFSTSYVWKDKNGEYVVAAKGAPEAIAHLCKLNSREKGELEKKVDLLAKDGLRIIAVAEADFRGFKLPEKQHHFNFKFLGLVGFEDPIRPNIVTSIRECYNAGIRVVMITGDYPETAKSIAKQIGLGPIDQILTGEEIDKLSKEELKRRVLSVNIFARVIPEHKLRLVEAFKENGEIVAMTGDGVNDAPALKAANIGIAMGKRGTDVAREASALVLLNDDFSSMVEAIKQGRSIYDNIRKALGYILAIHVPIAGIALIPVLLQGPLIFMPIHVVFLELIIDPACSVIFEAEAAEKDIMKRPPRRTNEPLFGRRRFEFSLLQGLVALAVIIGAYFYFWQSGYPEDTVRALTFTTLIVTNLGLIFTNRSLYHHFFSLAKMPNKALRFITLAALIFLGLALYLPFLQEMFHFSPVQTTELLTALIMGFTSILFFEGIKRIRKQKI